MYSAHNHQLLPYGLPPPAPGLSPWKPSVELAPNCPRCDSSNTKFCYYNNYSLTQPRYFCKGCRRYWTKGGSLRNVPIGGGCRKNRRTKSIRPSSDHSVTSTARSSTSLRPDLALDDMFRSSIGEAAGERPTIDLALLYSKFLNRCSPDHVGLVATTDQLPKEPEPPFDHQNISSSSSVQLPNQGLIHSGIEESLLINDVNDQMDVLGFSTDHTTGFESLDFSGVHGGSDVLMPNCSMAGFQDFHQVSQQYNALHDLVMGDLCTLDQFSFEHL